MFFFFGFCTVTGTAAPPEPKLSQQDYEDDFDCMWTAFREEYAYFDRKTTDWTKVKTIYRPRLATVRNRDDFIVLLESLLEELYDAHATLNTNTAASPRLVPAGADIWAEWTKRRAIITQVRPGSNADRAGLRAGLEVLSINGVPAERAVSGRIGQCLSRVDQAARNWALRVLLAGRHNEPRRLEVSAGEARRMLVIDDHEAEVGRGGKPQPLLENKRLGGERSIGYIRLNNSLGSTDLIKAFDAVLTELNDTRGLLLDLRNTPNGGNTTVARAIMGRFIDRDQSYQKHELPSEERQTGIKRSWVELVSPREPRYAGPVVVLVDHWTASMGEGLAIGLDATKRAKIVGTKMAGLAGAVHTITLPHTKIGVSFPVEKLWHVNGTPREDFVPVIIVDLINPKNKEPQDAILDAGLRALQALLPHGPGRDPH
jgi:carboxyl-terminal processing protease